MTTQSNHKLGVVIAMYRLALIMVSVALLLPFVCSAQVVYQGALSSTDGVGDIATAGTYGQGLCSIGWRVTQQEGPWGPEKGPYLYEYWITHPSGAQNVSHWLLEVTKEGELEGEPPFLALYPDFYNFSGNYTGDEPSEAPGPVGSVGGVEFENPQLVEVEVDWWGTQGQSNPNLPETMYGVKFDNLTNPYEENGSKVMYFAFDSWRHPVWADFYVKGGSTSSMWNKDFGTVYDDYGNNVRFLPVTFANDDGNLEVGDKIYAKILAPDGVVPEPATMALIALGIGAVAGTRRRKQKKD